MSGDAFDKRRQALEEEFFKKHNQKLVDKLRAELDKKLTRQELEQLTGISDAGVIDTLLRMNLDKTTFAAFGLYPLVEVAWADGKVDEKERAAFIQAAAEHGITPGSIAHTALQEFLARTPHADARKAWYAWAEVLNRKLDAVERRKVREGLHTRARAIAEASGGFLGMGNKISTNEQRVLDAIEKAFSD
jgi:uncharacterized tellurite resistance protein B-like protein